MTSRDWRYSPYRAGVYAYLAQRLLTFLVAIVKGLVTHGGVINQLTTWDGAWYLRVVYWGYPNHLTFVHGVATGTDLVFFPLLPELIRFVSDVTFVAPSITGLLLSGVGGLVAVFAVGALTREFAGDVVARRAALLFAVFPGAFVFSYIYCEGLLISFAAFALLALLRRQWVLAGVLGALATLTSPAGLPVVVAAVWASGSALRRRREWRSLWSVLLSPLGFLGWMFYLWRHTHVLNAWRDTEAGGWQSHPSLRFPFHVLADFLFDPKRPVLTEHLLFWGTVVALLGLYFAWRTHQPAVVRSYLVSAVALAAISEPVGLRPRFLTIAFPLAIAFAARFDGWRYRVVVTVSVIALVLMSYETLFSWAIFP